MTVPMWCPVARTINVGRGAGSMLGGVPRAIHHTTEGGSIDGAIATYRKTHNYPTFTIDYAKDDVVQHLAADVAATAVQNAAGGVQTNREGRLCIQIEWIGSATKPEWSHKPAGPRVRAFFDWLRALGIPDVWPMGAPMAYPGSYGLGNHDRDAAIWASHAGHYGHSQVPENHHGDPGAIDPNFIKQTARVAAQAAKSDQHGESDRDKRIKELKAILGIEATNADVGPAILKIMDAHAVQLGTKNPMLVRWLQRQANRAHHLNLLEDGVAGKATVAYVVEHLGQKNGVCGAQGYLEAAK